MTKFEYVSGTYIKRWYPEAATQSYKKGQPVYLEAGLLTVCADNSVEVLGIADADASTTTNTWLPVIVATPNTVFIGETTDEGADITTAITHMGIHCGLYVSTNTVLVDLGNTTQDCINPFAVAPNHIPDSASATLIAPTNALVLFTFLDAVMQFCDLEMT